MAKKDPTPEASRPPSFEEALDRLEVIVHQLEEGQTGLEESLASYEEGVKLLRHCHGFLARAQRRIEMLQGIDAEGNPVTEPLPEEESTLQEKASRRSRRRSIRGNASYEPNIPPSDEDPLIDGTSELF